VSLALLVPSVRNMFRLARRTRPEATAFAMFRQRVEGAREQNYVLVCAEPRCVAIGSFYFEFSIPRNVTIIAARDFANTPARNQRVFVLVNSIRGPAKENMTPQVEALQLPVVFQQRHIRLYDAGSGDRLIQPQTDFRQYRRRTRGRSVRYRTRRGSRHYTRANASHTRGARIPAAANTADAQPRSSVRSRYC
jgi:hypothetical protein